MTDIPSPEEVETEPLTSPDPIPENIAKLGELFPEAVAEGDVDLVALAQLLGKEIESTGNEETYGLSWNGKHQALQISITPSTGTLRPSPEGSVEWDATKNVVIEGDNLEVLKLLKSAYAGKIKLIYIDPPYNTGNDFVYKDDYKDNIANYLKQTGQVDEEGRRLSSNTETSGRFHTDWLNMMYPRLKLAKDLLSEDGVIFCSIDQNEIANLKALFNSIFGTTNLVGEIVAGLNPKGRQLGNFFATSHEYLLCFSKSIEACSLDAASEEGVEESDFPHLDEATGERYRLLPLRNTNKKFNPATSPTMHYPLFGSPASGEVAASPFEGSVEILPVFGDGSGAVWRWSAPKVEAEADDLLCREVSGQQGKRVDIFQIDRLTEGRKKKLTTIWPAKEVGSTDSGIREIKELIGPVFQTVKPLDLLKRIVARMPADSLILDFFAGSGTTGHAVMAQNAEDGGNRRYILVQLPDPLDPEAKEQKVAAEFCDELGVERNIAELTKERLRRAGEKVKADNPDFEGDTGFRVFKLDSTNIKAWDPDLEDLEKTLEDSIETLKEGRNEEDVLYEVLLKLGLDLCVPIETKDISGLEVSSIGAGTLFACMADELDKDSVEELGQGILAWRDELDPAGDVTCLFKDGAFSGDQAKTNLVEILKQGGVKVVRCI